MRRGEEEGGGERRSEESRGEVRRGGKGRRGDSRHFWRSSEVVQGHGQVRRLTPVLIL